MWKIGGSNVEKVQAVVARSTFRSQNSKTPHVQSTLNVQPHHTTQQRQQQKQQLQLQQQQQQQYNYYDYKS